MQRVKIRIQNAPCKFWERRGRLMVQMLTKEMMV
jgi:hypothetical protein